MTGLRRALGLVAIEGIVVGLVALALTLSSDHDDSPGVTAALGLFVGWCDGPGLEVPFSQTMTICVSDHVGEDPPSDRDRVGYFELRRIPSGEPGMSPLEIWCNEAQERYVLAISQAGLSDFEALCKRMRVAYDLFVITDDAEVEAVADLILQFARGDTGEKFWLPKPRVVPMIEAPTGSAADAPLPVRCSPR